MEEDFGLGFVILAFWLGSAGFALRRAWKLWRDPQYFNQVVQQVAISGFKPETRRGMVRGWIPFAGGLVAMAAGFPFVMVGTSAQGVAVLLVGLSLTAIFVVGVVLQLSVAWFNRPRWCVPPYLRCEIGSWARNRR